MLLECSAAIQQRHHCFVWGRPGAEDMESSQPKCPAPSVCGTWRVHNPSVQPPVSVGHGEFTTQVSSPQCLWDMESSQPKCPAPSVCGTWRVQNPSVQPPVSVGHGESTTQVSSPQCLWDMESSQPLCPVPSHICGT